MRHVSSANQDRRSTVDTSEPYLRNRAREERAIADECSSPDARRAHLELAVRYVKAAEALFVSTRGSTELPRPSTADTESKPRISETELRPALSKAFPLPASGVFSDLLSGLE